MITLELLRSSRSSTLQRARYATAMYVADDAPELETQLELEKLLDGPRSKVAMRSWKGERWCTLRWTDRGVVWV